MLSQNRLAWAWYSPFKIAVLHKVPLRVIIKSLHLNTYTVPDTVPRTFPRINSFHPMKVRAKSRARQSQDLNSTVWLQAWALNLCAVPPLSLHSVGRESLGTASVSRKSHGTHCLPLMPGREALLWIRKQNETEWSARCSPWKSWRAHIPHLFFY